MEPTGASANAVQTRVIPSLLRRAVPPAEVLETVVNATMEMAERHNLGWTREAEVKFVTARINSALRMIQAEYHPAIERIPTWLAPEFAEAWERVLATGAVPQLGRNLSGWYVRATPHPLRKAHRASELSDKGGGDPGAVPPRQQTSEGATAARDAC